MRRVSQVPGVCRRTDDLRSNLHHIYCFLASLNASFCVYLRFTHSTFITASSHAIRIEPHTLSLAGVCFIKQDQLVSMPLSSCARFQWLLFLTPSLMWPNVWSFSERLFIWKYASQVTLSLLADRLALWHTPEQRCLRVQTNTLCFQWGPASSAAPLCSHFSLQQLKLIWL